MPIIQLQIAEESKPGPQSVNLEIGTGSLELHCLRYGFPHLMSLKMPHELKATSLHWVLIGALWLFILNPLLSTGMRGARAERFLGRAGSGLPSLVTIHSPASSESYCPGKNTSSPLPFLSPCPSLIQRDTFHLILPNPLLWAHSSLPFPQHWGKPLLLQGEASLGAIFLRCKGSREVNCWLSLHELLRPFLVSPLLTDPFATWQQGRASYEPPEKQDWHLKWEILD